MFKRKTTRKKESNKERKEGRKGIKTKTKERKNKHATNTHTQKTMANNWFCGFPMKSCSCALNIYRI